MSGIATQVLRLRRDWNADLVVVLSACAVFWGTVAFALTLALQ